MKTRTYKSIIAAIILLQLIAIGASAFGAKTDQGGSQEEQQQLMALMADVMQAGVTITDYEMGFATGQMQTDESQYIQQRNKVFMGLDAMEKLTANNPQRLEIFQQQRKLVMGVDRIIQHMKEAIANRSVSREDRMGVMIILMTGMRKFSAIAHKISDNFAVLASQYGSAGSGPPIAPIVSAVCSLISLILAGVILAKPQTQI
jgi:hypothetical protein